MPPIDPLPKLTANHAPIFSEVIKDSQKIDKLRMIVGTELIDRCVFGSIVWEKNLGRPRGPKMSDHFDLLLCHTEIRTDYKAPGPRCDTIKAPIVGKWDDADDELVYRVFFVQGNQSDGEYWVEATFAPGTEWDVSNLRIVADTWIFTKPRGPIWLKPYEVKPRIDVDPWKSPDRLKL